MVLLLFIHCFDAPIVCRGFCVRYLFCYAVLCVFSSFAIIPLGKRGPVALLLRSCDCHVFVVVLCLFLTVPWVGL